VIVDASAVLAILLREDDAASFGRAIEAADVLRMSVVNYVEAAGRIDSSRAFDDFTLRTGIESHTVTPSSPRMRVRSIGATAKEITKRRSTSAIASRTPWPRAQMSPCCSRAMTIREPT